MSDLTLVRALLDELQRDLDTAAREARAEFKELAHRQEIEISQFWQDHHDYTAPIRQHIERLVKDLVEVEASKPLTFIIKSTEIAPNPSIQGSKEG